MIEIPIPEGYDLFCVSVGGNVSCVRHLNGVGITYKITSGNRVVTFIIKKRRYIPYVPFDDPKLRDAAYIREYILDVELNPETDNAWFSKDDGNRLDINLKELVNVV